MPAPENDRDAPFAGAVPPPAFVNVETTRFCNLRCRMCVQFQDGTTVAGPHMGLAEFERIAASVFPYVERWQPSVSGEPLMSRDFVRMLELAERFGVKAELYTNATLLHPNLIEKLAPNLATVTVSFDGATPETFEAIREGADFADVAAGIRRLVQHCRTQLPASAQPQFGMNCTLMERNVRELPDLVRLCAQHFGFDYLHCNHVFPVTPEMRRQSLVHHRELARECIDAAFAVAAGLGFVLRVEALDQITAQTALASGEPRAWATRDGVVEGLEYRELNADRRRPWPRLDPQEPAHAEVLARRDAAYRRSGFPSRRAADPAAPARGGMWYCEFLWEKTYVSIGGDVRPCCVMGTPVVGNLNEEPFERIWNNDAYRAMRQRLAAQQPVAACKGCMHIRRVDDPVQVDRHLGGQRLPRPDELLPVPPALDPARQRPVRSGEPPLLTWPVADDAREYVLQFSLDGFASVLFATDGPMGGPAIRDNRYAVPPWAWRQAPVDREISWRVLARTAAGDRELLRGAVPAEEGAAGAGAAEGP